MLLLFRHPAYFNNEFVSCSRALANACDNVCCANGTSLSAPRMDTLLAMVAGSVSRIILRQQAQPLNTVTIWQSVRRAVAMQHVDCSAENLL